jgi:hypothetical protein
MESWDALQDRLARELRELPAVRAAYLTLDDSRRRRVHFWTLLDQYDEPTERRLVRLESDVEHQFADEVDFAFTTIHLKGRDPQDFIPPGALIVKLPS